MKKRITYLDDAGNVVRQYTGDEAFEMKKSTIEWNARSFKATMVKFEVKCTDDDGMYEVWYSVVTIFVTEGPYEL